jgi:hypothetical protein
MHINDECAIIEIIKLITGPGEAREAVENSPEPCNEACTQAVSFGLHTDEEIDKLRESDEFVDALWDAMCKTQLNFKGLN